MVRKKSKDNHSAFSVFNVTYEDGSVTSNRRISKDLLDESFGDNLLDMARAAIKHQDDEISRRSSRPRAEIKTIIRV